MKRIKRSLALLMVLCMIFSVVPFNAFATGSEVPGGSDPAQQTESQPTEGSSDSTTEEVAPEATDSSAGSTETPDDPAPETTEEAAGETIGDEPAGEEPGLEDPNAEGATGDDEKQPLSLEEVYVTSGRSVPYSGEFLKIVHLDCGRKYFTVDWVKSLIDEMATDGYTHLELAFGNDGLRFLLDDMEITVGDATYTSDAVKAGIQAGNKAYHDAGTNEWTQAQMDGIITYAKNKGIGIIPLLNSPGHMDAIIDAMEYVGITDAAFSADSYGTSGRTIDVGNAEAVAFTQELVKKYVTYFAGQGCRLFNLGTDEYANDILISYPGMGFGYLQAQEKYDLFVKYVNSLAYIVSNAGMTPMAFNDGIYYGSVTASGTFNKDILITYWSNGWGNYQPASAQFLAEWGYQLVNTHGDFYYVLGKSDNFDSGSGYAENWDNKAFMGTTFDDDQAGAMFCIWCDYPGAETEAQITEKVIKTGILSALSEKMGHEKTVEQSTVECSEGTISVTAPGLTSVNCERVDPPAYSADGATVVGYDITPYVDGVAYTGSGTVTIPVPSEVEDCNSIRIYDAAEEKFVASTIADGVITFTASHFSEYDIVGQNIEVTNNKTITVSVGGTATDTIEGTDYSSIIDRTNLDANIASVSAEYAETSAVKEVTAIESGKQYLIVNTRANKLLTGTAYSSGLSLNGTLAADSSELWTITSSGSGYTVQNSKDQYLSIGSGTANLSSSSATLSLNYTNSTWTIERDSYYLNDYEGRGTTAAGWKDSTAATDSGSQWKIYEVIEGGTTVTFTGVKAGITYVTVGDTYYTINVIAEDLSKVAPLTVEYWITNRKVTDNGATSGTISASAEGVYSESGALFSGLVPATGTHDNNTMAFWKGTRLDSNNKQTAASGVDRSNSGTDFTYIRYWNSSWAYSADGKEWTNVENDDQIVAYYLQKTTVTDEVTTEVVDWGVVPSTSYDSTNFVLIDYAVKYESGDRTPSSFPVSGKTMAFHCDPSDSTTVHRYNNGSNWNNYYRDIGMIKAEDSDEYEVYMITVTMTNDSNGTQVAGNAQYATSYTYDGTEYVVWAATQEDLNNSGLKTYSSISGKYNYSINGGEAVVPGLEIFNRHGALITYYVRAKVTEDSLTVHYIDRTANQEFYYYNIAVKSGITFNTGIALDEPWKGPLLNGTVTNSLNKTQTVSADLSTMPAIGAQYRISDYQCVKVERSENGKDVYLYYTFNNTHSFVIDFGLPLEITADKLNINTSTVDASEVSGAVYGTAEIAGGKLTYTPNKMLLGTEILQLKLTDNGTTSVHQIYIYPATTVYYEEGFATLNGFTGGSTGAGTQATQVAGESTDVYGYDAAYGSSTVGASNGTQATSTAQGDTAEFTFTGTGVDIYANSTTETGWLMIHVKKVNDNTTVTAKLVQVDTAMKNGNTDATDDQGVTGYNIPVASFTDLNHDTYTVTITHVAVDKTPKTVHLDGFRVYNTLAEEPDFYKKDMEDNPTFIELRDKVLAGLNVNTGSSQYASQIAKNTLSQVYATGSPTEGAVVLSKNDAFSNNTDVQDLLDNGPKNEIYLRENQALVFKITTSRVVQIGLKALNAETSYRINNDASVSLNSSTDMFYTVLRKSTSESEQTITITNTGSGILSITKLKVCDDPGASLGVLTEEDLVSAVESLGFPRDPGETVEPTNPVDPTDPVDPVEPTVPVEPEIADASLTVSLVDYTGKELASAVLSATGLVGDAHTFSAQEILAAASGKLPSKYALVSDTADDVEVAFGEAGTVKVQAGKVATLKITYVSIFGKKVGTATITKVQTAPGACRFTAAEIKAAAPAGRRVTWFLPAVVAPGTEITLIVPTI